jgi:hypothetical protein
MLTHLTARFSVALLMVALVLSAPALSNAQSTYAQTGDTYQQTTKGLAIYRRADNTPTFVSGSSRWSLTSDGLVEQMAVR